MSSDEARADGRTLRKERNVGAVLDAVHVLFVEGQHEPAAEEVAARSGVSLRSIYRYFPDREQLLLAALQRRLDEADHLYGTVGDGGGFDDRLATYLAQRLELYDVIAPTARVALVAARQMPTLAEVVRERRQRLLQLVRDQFAPELAGLDQAERERAATAVGVLCQFESIESLRCEQGLDATAAVRVLEAGVRALLQPVAVG